MSLQHDLVELGPRVTAALRKPVQVDLTPRVGRVYITAMENSRNERSQEMSRKYADPIRHAAKVAKARAEAQTRRTWNVDEAEREAERESRRVGQWKPVGNMVRKTREQEAREERADRERIARRSEGR